MSTAPTKDDSGNNGMKQLTLKSSTSSTTTTTRNGRASNRGAIGYNINGNARKTKRPVPGEATFRRFLEGAEYEIQIDPYRGMSAFAPNVEDETVAEHVLSESPWSRCRFGYTTCEETGFVDDPDDAAEWVSCTCLCACPTVIRWTEDGLSQQARKRKRKRQQRQCALSRADQWFGQRRPASNNTMTPSPAVVCACDFNPFCLATVGGAMNIRLCDTAVQVQDRSQEQQDEELIDNRSATKPKNQGNVVTIDDDSDDDDEGGSNHNIPAADAKAQRQEHVSSGSGYDGDADENNSTERENGTESAAETMSGDAFPSRRKAVPEPPPCMQGPLTRRLDPDSGLTNEQVDPDDRANSIYTRETLEKLRGVRASQWVNVRSIVRYLESTLQGLVSASPEAMAEYITLLRQRHERLVFINPLVDDDNDDDDIQQIIPDGDNNAPASARTKEDRIRIAMPPGISNLGATCYLNTQLQCLAQNQVFLEGIFSWRPSRHQREQDDRMTSVLSLFQSLLVRMHSGPHSTVNTLEFSNALGLDHHEQQDPNEFSRLLLERMHESFCNSSKASQGEEGEETREGYNLANLLPHLFQGIMTYETICLTCQTKSQRQEEFMDLNLPIVRPDASKTSPKRFRQLSLLETLMATNSKAAATDTDVQICLDKYCQDEYLEGDNQYFCSRCNSKQDAIRTLSFRKLPPVLNVQLSRYVFDRQNFTKKKLSDKVLLPTELRVQAEKTDLDEDDCDNGGKPSTTGSRCKSSREDPHADGGNEQRYVLCAVMRHKGTSAYSGHYVAEAMDWPTGIWFEFNDENVTLLAKGPSCSYDPSAAAASAEENKKAGFMKAVVEKFTKRAKNGTLCGSSEAYNLYYVDERFLAQSTWDSLRKRKRNAGSSGTGNDGDLSAVDVAAIHRKEYYADLMQMIMDDGKEGRRWNRRKYKILKDCFPDFNQEVACYTSKPHDLVWIDGGPFRRFMSGDGQFDEDLARPGVDGRDVLRHSELFCDHDKRGIHPRVARRGKLIPRHVYDAVIATIEEESGAVLERRRCAETALNDYQDEYAIRPSCNLFCDLCADEYRSQLKKKLELLRNITDLHDMLDLGRRDDASVLEYDDVTLIDNEEDLYAYAVHRKFATKFRALVTAKLFKQAAGAESATNGAPSKKDAPEQNKHENSSGLDEEQQQPRADSVYEGIDGMDLTAFAFGSDDYTNRSDEDTLDVRVNSGLTCAHGRCKKLTKTTAGFVSWTVWKKIKTVFPSAIEHRRKRHSALATPEDVEPCPECEAEGDHADELTKLFIDLAKQGHSWSVKSISPLDIQQMTLSDHSYKYALVHADELRGLQCFVRAFRGNRNRRAKTEDIVSEVEELLVPAAASIVNHSPLVDDASSSPAYLFLKRFMRPLVCKTHAKPIRTAVFQANKDEEPNGTGKVRSTLSLQDSDRIVVLNEGTHKSYLGLLAAISSVLCSEDRQQAAGLGFDEDFSLAMRDASDWRLARCHPVFERSDDPSLPKFAVTSEDKSMVFRLCSPLCDDEECNSAFASWQKDEDKMKAAKDKTKKNRSAAEPTGKYSSTAGSAAHDPISVESDLDEVDDSVFSLRVFELQPEADNKSILDSLSQCGLSIFPVAKAGDTGQVVRRSTRKRKSRNPIGSILGEESVQADVKNNVAALRLMLLERCTEGDPFELNHSLKLVIVTNGSSCETPIVVDCDESGSASPAKEDSPAKVLDLCFDLNEESLLSVCESAVGGKLDKAFKPAENLVLLRQSVADESFSEIPKDTLMDFLIGMANTTTTTSGEKRNRSKGKKAMEKGFTGTLLSSAPAPAASTDEKKGDVDGVVGSDSDRDRPAETTKSRAQDDHNGGSETERGFSGTNLSSTGNHHRALHEGDTVTEVTGSEAFATTPRSDGGREPLRDMNIERSSNGSSGTKDSNLKVNSGDSPRSTRAVEVTEQVGETRQASKKFLRRNEDGGIVNGVTAGTEVSVLEMLESDDDDDGGLFDSGSGLLRTTTRKKNPQRAMTVAQQRGSSSLLPRRQQRDHHNEAESQLALKLASLLMRNPDVEKEQESACFDAASWAVDNNPTEQNAENLADTAYAKYIEIILEAK